MNIYIYLKIHVPLEQMSEKLHTLLISIKLIRSMQAHHMGGETKNKNPEMP